MGRGRAPFQRHASYALNEWTQDVINDGGGHIFYNYDQANSEAFAYVAIFYNAAGTAYQQLTASDNGTTSYTYF